MRLTKPPKKRFDWDIEEDEKFSVFMRLNELAKRRSIAVLFVFRTMTDYSGEGSAKLQFHYDGPKPTRDVCLFCQQPTKEEDHGGNSETFSIHDDCYDSRVNDWGMNFHLEAGPHRPAVIVIVAWFPGSIDNLLMGVAWGLGVHYLVSRRHLPSSEEAIETADVFAHRLVRQLQKPRVVRRVN